MTEGFDRALQSALADSTLRRGDFLVWECSHVAPTGRLGAFGRPGQPPDLERDALLDNNPFDEVEAVASECRIAVVTSKDCST